MEIGHPDSVGASVSSGPAHRPQAGGALVGHLDHASLTDIGGWAAELGVGHAQKVTVEIGEFITETVVANNYRPDLDDAGIRNGNAAFRLDGLDEILQDLVDRNGFAKISAKHSGADCELVNSPAFIIKNAKSGRGIANIFTITFFDLRGQHFFHGGAERYIIDLANMLSSLGLETVIYQASNSGHWERTYRGIKVVGVSCSEISVWQISIELHKGSAPGAINIYSPFTLACRNRHSPSIGISHGIYWDVAGNEYSAGRNPEIILSGMKHCDKLVSVDTNTINFIRAVRPDFVGKMSYVTNYVSDDFFIKHDLPAVNVIPQKRRDILICFPRRLYNPRGFHLLEEVLPRICRKYPGVEFWLVGGIANEDRSRLASLLARHPNQATWFECQPEAMKYVYQFADISLIPTVHSEGTSLSALEAMAAGNCVIATNVGGLTDIVVDEINGLLINPDPADLYEAICRVLDNPDLRHRLARDATRFARAFSKQKWEGSWLNILKKFLPQGSPRPDSDRWVFVHLKTDGIAWSSMQQRPHHIARALARLGMEVYFCSDQAESIESVENARKAGVTLLQPDGEVHVKNAILFSYYCYHYPYLKRQDIFPGCDMPEFDRKVEHDPIVNVKFDNARFWFDLLDHPDIHQDDNYSVLVKDAISSAHIVTYSSAPLQDFVEEFNNSAIFVQNGVFVEDFSAARNFYKEKELSLSDYKDNNFLFSKVPAEDLRRLTCYVYYGAFAEWTDYALLHRISDVENSLLLLAGPISEASHDDMDILRKKGNVKYFGVLRYDDLSSLLKFADIGLAPFQISEMTHAVLPLKMLEYLASGRPVLASRLGAIASFRNNLDSSWRAMIEFYDGDDDLEDLSSRLRERSRLLRDIKPPRILDWLYHLPRLGNKLDFPPMFITQPSVETKDMGAITVRLIEAHTVEISIDVELFTGAIIEFTVCSFGIAGSLLSVGAYGRATLYGGSLMLSDLKDDNFDTDILELMGDSRIVRHGSDREERVCLHLKRGYNRGEGNLRLALKFEAGAQ